MENLGRSPGTPGSRARRLGIPLAVREFSDRLSSLVEAARSSRIAQATAANTRHFRCFFASPWSVRGSFRYSTYYRW